MSHYGIEPIDVSGLRTIPIAERGGKVQIEHFAAEPKSGRTARGLLDALPKLLAADTLRGIINAMVTARDNGKPVIWGFGGHVVKCGLAPVLLHMMRHGWATAFTMNGSTAIHDFEIAIAGCTSEDVEAVLPDGRFGSAEETGREMNLAIRDAATRGTGIGEALGERLSAIAPPQYAHASILHTAWAARVPVTVHVAVGTDTPHTHPAADGAAIGAATHNDFRLFAALTARLNEGGVYINAGSAVVLPEVFLKAVSLVRNLGQPLRNFTTVNLDFLQHYRPRVNVVERPHAQAGGRGFSLTGHHEINIPLIAAILAEYE